LGSRRIFQQADFREQPVHTLVLLVLDGFAVLLWFFQGILLRDHPAISYPGLALSFVAEVGLGLWLLIRGVK
jgi:hypothetical protein